MYKAKFLFLLFSLLINLVIYNPRPALAAIDLETDIDNQLSQAAGSGHLGEAVDPRYIAANIIGVVLDILGMIFFVLILYAGFLWMTAGGEEEQVNKAKKLLTQAVIGLIIILSAYSITLFAVRLALGENDASFWNPMTW